MNREEYADREVQHNYGRPNLPQSSNKTSLSSVAACSTASRLPSASASFFEVVCDAEGPRATRPACFRGSPARGKLSFL